MSVYFESVVDIQWQSQTDLSMDEVDTKGPGGQKMPYHVLPITSKTFLTVTDEP